MDSTTQGLIWLVVLFALYFLPTIVARLRGAENPNPTFIINFFLGWTLLGWVIALAMGAGAKTRERQTQHSAGSAAIPSQSFASIAGQLITVTGASTSIRGRVLGPAAAPLFPRPDVGSVAVGYVPTTAIFDVLGQRGVFTQIRLGGQVEGWLATGMIEHGNFQPVAPVEKTCPRCAETVKAAAKVCRFCGHDFEAIAAT